MTRKLPSFIPGEPFDAKKVKAIQQAVEANAPQRGGPGVRVTRKPWGWNASYAASSSFMPQIWRVTMQGSLKNLTITIGRGLVMGVEPVIKTDKGDEVPISGSPKTKPPNVPPQLKISQDAFDLKKGQGLLYLSATMSHDWFIQKVMPVALAAKPASEPFTAYKLLGFFVIQGGSVQYQQMCYFNLGLGTLFDRRPSGAARYVWYAV